MFGADGMRRIMSQDTIKPQNTRQTLSRLAGYFKPFWPALLVVAVLLVANTWAQVKVPELIGATVDCYLTPGLTAVTDADQTGGVPSFLSGLAQGGQRRCTLEDPNLDKPEPKRGSGLQEKRTWCRIPRHLW